MRHVIFLFLLTISFQLIAQDYSQNSVLLTRNGEKYMNGFFKSWTKDWYKVEKVNFYGGGQLLSLVTSDEESAETTSPSGSLGVNLSTPVISTNLYFSYNAKQRVEVNTLSRLGAILMNPDLSGQSFTLSTRIKLNDWIGINGRFQVVDNDWQLDSSAVLDASPISSRVGLYIRPLEIDIDDENELDFYIDLNYTHRSIFGDFSSQDRNIQGKEISDQGYNGFEMQVNLRFNALTMYVRLTSNEIYDLELPGFSGKQVLFGFSVTGPVVSL